MTTTLRSCGALAAVSILLSLAAGAAAQGTKKLYCWNENGRKICGDALPPEAAASARTEISGKSGLPTAQVARALTSQERAAAASANLQAQLAAEAEAARQRRDLAMVESYASEADLRTAYGQRTGLVDAALKASALGETNLRLSLVALLGQANNLELAGKPVAGGLVDNIRNQHEQLQKLLRIAAQQRTDRAALEVELADAVARYRAMKQPAAGATPAPNPPQPPG